MRIPAIPLRLVVVACMVPWLALCGGEREQEPAETAPEATADTVEADTAGADTARARIDTAGAVLAGGVANGQPMPSAEQAGGIPPYPNAIVWNRFQRDNPEYLKLEAFTSDSPKEVVSFYDRELSGWDKVRAKDAVIYRKGQEEASMAIMPWKGGNTPSGSAEVLREARTAIGLAWRR